LAARWATYSPYKPQLGGQFRRAKNDMSQMRRPVELDPEHPPKDAHESKEKTYLAY